MVDVKELLEYNEATRHEYFKTFTKLPWKQFTRNMEASFHSMRNIFIHTLGAIDYWLDVLQNQNIHSEKDFNEYKTFEQVKTYMEHVEKRTHTYLKQLTPKKLQSTCTIKDDDDKTRAITHEDILVHLVEEEIHHRGELNALLWQIGIDPPPMGYKNL
jgi:uncharacterized damage-inducible protein DinB